METNTNLATKLEADSSKDAMIEAVGNSDPPASAPKSSGIVWFINNIVNPKGGASPQQLPNDKYSNWYRNNSNSNKNKGNNDHKKNSNKQHNKGDICNSNNRKNKNKNNKQGNNKDHKRQAAEKSKEEDQTLRLRSAVAADGASSSSASTGEGNGVMCITEHKRRRSDASRTTPLLTPLEPKLKESGVEIDDDTSDLADYHYYHADVIPVDEDREHEFKGIQKSRNPVESILRYCEEYINAFLNTNGGTIYFGISDDGKIAGVPLNKKQRDQLRLGIDNIVNAYRPQVDPSLYSVQFALVKKPTSQHQDQPQPQPQTQTQQQQQPNKPQQHEDRPLFIIKVAVEKGPAPVYFTKPSGTSAYMRRDGGNCKMSIEVIHQRTLAQAENPRAIVYNEVPEDFIGRMSEIMQIREFIANSSSQSHKCKIIALTGSPCVGKSTLARRLIIEITNSYPDAQFFIDLKGVTSSYISITDAMKNLVLSNYPTTKIPDSESELKGLYSSCFANKRTILLIENVGSAQQIEKLLPHNQRCCVIVTSRKNLALDASLQLTSVADVLSTKLKELKEENAMKLLRGILYKHGLDPEHNYHLDDNECSEIVRMCGCLPLPIRVVARVMIKRPNIPPSMIIKQMRNVDKRIEMVESSFEGAFELLSSSEELGEAASTSTLEKTPGTPNVLQMRIMSIGYIFPGTFDVLAACSIFFDCQQTEENQEETLNCLGELLESNMLDFDTASQRYWQNDLLRLYIRRKAERHCTKEQLEQWQQNYLNHFAYVIKKANELYESESDAAIYKGLVLFELDASNFEMCLTLMQRQHEKLLQQGASETAISEFEHSVVYPFVQCLDCFDVSMQTTTKTPFFITMLEKSSKIPPYCNKKKHKPAPSTVKSSPRMQPNKNANAASASPSPRMTPLPPGSPGLLALLPPPATTTDRSPNMTPNNKARKPRSPSPSPYMLPPPAEQNNTYQQAQ